ncbi:MAG: hypothetical protein LBQ64_02775 [Bacteroidales bacterium]|jgi:hypothetical protein|nr:hypothetical protein [Bacteroidales bacterium]
MASGHISYGTGTAVPGARVVAEPLNEGDAANARKSVYFNGSATSYMLINNTTKVLGGQEFSFQAWINPQTKQNATIFSTDNNQVSLKYTSLNTMEFKTPAATLTFVDTFAQLNQYSQLTAVYAGNKMQVYINGILCQTTTFSQQSYTAQSTDNVKIGTNFRGNIDEIRFWGRSLDSAAIAENMGMYLIGNESSFRAYYRFEEAIPSAVYDMSFTGNDNYNRNNAQLVNAVLTDSIPNQSQLSVSGITDVNGNYIIGAIPYAGTGTTYRFVPMFDVHTFNPTNKVRMISANTPVQSDIDFEDVSSFQVSGTILYAGTSVPVSGVSFVVDGSNPCMKDGRLIETDANGQYTIEVPIGWHFITAQKSGHILAALRGVNGYIANNRFPADSVARYDFQATEELNFTDSTRVELVGRFTGGPVEAKKPVGFGLSKNNLGVAELTFSLVKNGMTNLNTTDVVETHVSSSGRLTNTQTYTRQSNQVKVTTNPQTGEFVAWLIPEDHQVNVLNNSTIVSSTNPAHSVTYSGIISMKTQTETGYLYDSDTSTVAIDEGNKQITDTIYYHQKLDLIYRASPTIEVLNASTSDTIFGDTLHVITDDLGNKDTLNLVENRQYATGLPVFTHQGTYAFDISVFEQYDNRDGNPVVVDRVPTVDGTVIANTDMVTGNYPTEAALDQNGKAQITFMIDAPNVTYNSNDPSQSYTKNFNFQVNFSDGTPSKQWNPVNRNAYVFGAKSDGNNFVTKGPKRVTIVLRDPPGSNSYAWVEKGSVINSTHSWGARFGNTTGITTKFAYGVDLETFAGIGAGLIISSEVKNDYTVGLNTAHAGGWDNSSSTVTTITKTISTSAEPDYVGPDADVFVGAAYNIIFGEAKMIGVIDENNVTDPVGSVLTSRSGKNYMVGSERGMFLVPEFETDFYFTRKHIVDNVIPNLEKIRNTMLTYDPSMPTSGNLTNSPVYISILPPDDPNFGKSNRDTKAFGQAATTFARRYDIGDSAVLKTPSLVNSYYILNPDSWAIDSLATDSLQFYNTDIDAWKQVLANDEKQMLEAAKLKNISFDAGAIYEESSATETTHSYTNVYEGSANLVGALNTGATFNATGVFFTIEEEVNSSFYDNETEENTTSVTYGYHLEDGDPSDYHTVDIKKPSTPYATAFKLLGGQTSCPYEGEITAQYYETTGSAGILQQGTSMVQDPYMSINTNFIGNVPGNRSANFSLLVGNGSLVSDAWYMLTVDEKTNPDGLILEVDGLPIGNGRVFAFDPTEAFNKTLSVRRTRQDVTEYNDIRLVLASTCQDDLFDELWISVHFLPACSDLVLDRPVSNQILNILSGDSAQFIVNQYDVNYLNFDHIVLEYKPATQNAYIPFGYYYKDSAAYKNASTVPDDQKQVIDNNATDLRQWWKAPVQDGFYLLRARSVCPAGAALSYESISDEVQVVKDMISPIVFGTPQPADGILAVDDNLLIDFNEAIQPDYTYRISVQGELNGEELLHNAGLQFDGVNDVVEINQPLNLEGKSFTVEMWTLRDNSNPHNAVLFSHGTQDSKFELGVDASHKLWVRIDEDSVSAVMPVQDITNSWTHIAAVFDNEQNNISVYVNGNAATNAGGIPSHITSVEYAATGIITVGGDFDKMNCYNGKMNELRLWTKALSGTKLYEQMSKKLSGTEAGLAGYWQMNEARGTLVSDRIRGRNGVTTAQWYALPVGRSLSFNGNGYAKTSITEIGPEADFSLEFWFRADSLNSNACLFSTGRGDNGDEIQSGNQLNDKFSIYFDASQNLVLRSSGKTAAIASNLADNDWHHFAMSVSRRGNANIYIDANLQTSLYAADYFGSFKASKLYLGAMGWEKNFTTDTVAYFFRGNIDELRIWKAMLTREGIRIASSSRLNGDEAGLRAYYPFDTTETVTLIHPTLCDQMDTSRIDNGEEARRNEAFVLYSGASSSVLAANITPARRLQNVPFERVYNENQIYLNLTAPMSSIENCVLEISVSDVKDMHGNIIVNPVKWTAFIDRNYLKWGEEHFSFVKNVFDPLSFTVEVINRSGLEQTFNIENMPAWLSVSPSSGTISPAGKITVRFTVDEGLNAGIYDENIYLRNSNGFNELLAIDLRVLGSKPEWEVDASQYNYSMNIFGELNINGIVSTDPEDMLAAFAGNTCVGIANLRYVDQYDRHLAFLNVYGNTGGTPLHFKIWDASAGIIYTMITPDTLVFAENSYYGTAKTPITFRAINYIEQHIPLAQGWNWISKNVSTPAMTSINATFVNNSFASGDLLKSQFNGFDQYSNNSWIGNISLAGGMNNTQMYMLKVETDKTLILAGEAVDPTTETITIYPGWTWTGFTPQINLSTQEAFVGADPQDGNIVKNQTSFSIYYEGIGWIGTLNYLSPGKGYIYYSTAQDTVEFTYPTVSSLTSNRKSMPQHGSTVNSAVEVPGQYSDNLSIIGSLQADGIDMSRTQILCYAGDEYRGAGVPVYVEDKDEWIYFITAGGESNGDVLSFRLKTANGETIGLKERLQFGTNRLYGTVDRPMVFSLGSEDAVLTAYPVPFSSELTLAFTLDDASKGQVSFTLTDVMGSRLLSIERTYSQAGYYTLSLDREISSLSAGVYFIGMTTSTGKHTVKTVKIK